MYLYFVRMNKVVSIIHKSCLLESSTGDWDEGVARVADHDISICPESIDCPHMV